MGGRRHCSPTGANKDRVARGEMGELKDEIKAYSIGLLLDGMNLPPFRSTDGSAGLRVCAVSDSTKMSHILPSLPYAVGV